jgi:acetyl-CoA/propionyl-CoA carboxylase biotin carboxyl carrier protein
MMKIEVEVAGAGSYAFDLPELAPGQSIEIEIAGRKVPVVLHALDGHAIDLEVGGKRRVFILPPPSERIGADAPKALELSYRNRPYRVEARTPLDALRARAGAGRESSRAATALRSLLPGVVRQVYVAIGQTVGAGAPLLTLEAMKMENEIRAECAGTIAELPVRAGQTVSANELLVRIEPSA